MKNPKSKLGGLNSSVGYKNQWYADSNGNSSYQYSKNDGYKRNGNRSLQRNVINLNQPLVSNGHDHLNQSVEGDILFLNSKFSPTNPKFGYPGLEVKRTNSSIKINSESSDQVMPLESSKKPSKVKAGRMWSTLNHFYKKSPFMKYKSKQKQNKIHVYQHQNDYTSEDKTTVVNRKKLSKVKDQFLMTSHPYMQERPGYQSRCGSDLKFGWKSGLKQPKDSKMVDVSANKNLTELSSGCWKTTKSIKGKPKKVSDYYNNRLGPYVRNNLPPVILKTAQCFYTNNKDVGTNNRNSSTKFIDTSVDEEVENVSFLATERR